MDDAKRPNGAGTGAGPAGGDLEGLGFEEAIGRLGQAVEALEAGDLGLDAALARYEEGVRLLGRCKALLDSAERRVALLTGVADDGTPQVEPFDTQATVDRTAPPAASSDSEDDGAPF